MSVRLNMFLRFKSYSEYEVIRNSPYRGLLTDSSSVPACSSAFIPARISRGRSGNGTFRPFVGTFVFIGTLRLRQKSVHSKS